MVSVSRFALLRAFVLISAWSQSLNFTWHPSNLRQKGSPHFSMLFALVCCDSCFDFGDVCTFISVPRWHTACLSLIWRLYIFIYAALTQRVSFICLALFVSSLLIDKPKLGSVATNRFVYRKLLGGLGGFYPVPFGVPLWVSFTDFGFCIWKFTNLYWEIAISKP